MVERTFLDYMKTLGSFQQRSMFGGIGLFQQDAMFLLIDNKNMYLRGGDQLDYLLIQLGCERYAHVKKQNVVMINYYNITALFLTKYIELDLVIKQSIIHSTTYRDYRCSPNRCRLRDLPNMQLTLERMVKKAGVDDVETFITLGPLEVFYKVRTVYGNDLDIKLLWKFAGAVEGIHWRLLQEPRKQQLLDKL